MAVYHVVIFLAFIITCYAGVPVYVMLPLNTVQHDSTLTNPDQLLQQLQQLKSGGVKGVMADVWWGIGEQQPTQYNFSGYQHLLQLCQSAGLELQVVMSFHQCGGNVGDDCNITLPPWVLKAAPVNQLFYTDNFGHSDPEYISLGMDDAPVLQGRTPVQVYSDFMQAFAQTFRPYLGSVITLVEVGLGPAGELRYPSYQSAYWKFCGVGAFQCFDTNMLQMFRDAAAAAGHPEWDSPPKDAGSYNSAPQNTAFFLNGYATEYGQFFLSWYSSLLIEHGDKILTQARKVFGNSVPIAGKVAGVHWLYNSPSHAAELTAGYYNTNGHDGYLPIAEMFKRNNAWFLFTCMEMQDNEIQPASCLSAPQELVAQTRSVSWSIGVSYAGENALPRYDATAYHTIESGSAVDGHLISAFTYLRLDDTLLSQNNWPLFTSFVSNMNNLS